MADLYEVFDSAHDRSDSPSTPPLSGCLGGLQPEKNKLKNVVELDIWATKRGEKIANEWSEDDIAEHEAILVADAHAILFDQKPALVENPEDADRHKWFERMMDTPEYRSLHLQTQLKTGLSEIAAKTICDKWVEYKKTHENESESDGENGCAGEDASDEESIQDSIDRIDSTSQALKQASENVSGAMDAANGLGIGEGVASQLKSEDIAKFFLSARNGPLLKQIMLNAGRFIRVCQSLQRRKIRHGKEEFCGITVGGRLSRLINREKMKLSCGIPSIELDSTYRLMKKQSLSKKYQSREKLGKGPIVVTVDESGSMEGDRISAAKGLAAALGWLARRQNRWFAGVSFSDNNFSDNNYGPGLPAHFIGKTKKWDQVPFIEWLLHMYWGGTDPDCPLVHVPFTIWPYLISHGLPVGKTDHLIITDGCMDVPEKMAGNYRDWAEKNQVTTWGIFIGPGGYGSMEQVCDKYWCVPNLTLATKAVESVLSI